MAGKRHVIVGGGTAAINAITTIREYDKGASDIVLVADERPYSRMVLPYYLGKRISRSHVHTLTPVRLAELGVATTYVGRRATGLDTAKQQLTLDNGETVDYDDLLLATGSSAVRAPVPGADLPGVHSFWTLEQADGLIREVKEGCQVVLVGAGFIAFTILNSLVHLGVKLTVIELAPTILPRMIDATGAAMATRWLEQHGVTVRTGVRLASIEEVEGRKRLNLDGGDQLDADVVIMATGIRPNLDWLDGAGLEMNRGLIVDDHMRTSAPNVYAAGDIAEAFDRVTGERAVHAIEPAAMEHGRIVGANMAGVDRAHRGTVLMNIVDVLDLEIASFGSWDDPDAQSVAQEKPQQWGYRRLLWHGGGDRMTGAIIIGISAHLWATNDVGILKGLVQDGQPMGEWKQLMLENPWEVKRPFVATGHVRRLLTETVLDRPSRPADEAEASEWVSPEMAALGAQTEV
jgi:NAD(P)H-nitrite reductase large subunit